MGQTLDLIATDGHRFAAYVATPAGTPRGALVVLQEIFGVNPHIRSVADAYAADGYLAIAPAMFDRAERGVELGYTPDETQRGMALKAACADATALLDIAAAVAHGRSAGRVGIVGYCWGGYLSWLASGAVDGLAASIPYYGGGMPKRADVQPRCPVLAHFGEKDGHIPVDAVNALQAAHPEIAVQFYPAGHGFNRDVTAAYHAASAQLARERTLALLRLHIG
jgi:carboxymethylenebutenolidase